MNTNNSIVRKRESNIELYRIVLMLAIIAHHYVINSPLIDVLNSSPLTAKSFLYYFLGMWGKTGVNCFVLITGYYMCTSNITLRKFLKIFFEIWFYVIVIWVVFFISGKGTLYDLKEVVIRYTSLNRNFANCFIYFYLLIPFLNILIKSINKTRHELLLLFCIFLYVIVGSVPKIHFTMNYVEWFCVLYLIASYIRIYGFPIKLPKKSLGGVFLISVVLAICSVYIMAYFFRSSTDSAAFWFVADSNHILAVVVSVCAFLFILQIHIPYSPIINKVASSVFGVLLIHSNGELMKGWLWNDCIDVIGQYNSSYHILYAIVSVMLIFIGCVIIDQIRIYLVERPILKIIEKRLIIIHINI